MTNFDHTSSFTRYDLKTRSFTLIDGILVSRSLLPRVSNVRINNHDHVPVEIDLTVNILELEFKREKSPRFINWKELLEDSKCCYRQKMADNLASI